MAKKQKKDPYAICTAQKKKSGMGHDAWKRCVDKIKTEEATMEFFERVRLIEKRKKTEAMGNIPDDDRPEPDGPEPEAQATASNNRAQATLDQQDTEEMSEPGKVDASKKSRAKKEDLDPSGGKTEMKEKKDKDWIQKAVDPDHEGYCTPMTKDTCTPQRKALAKTFKKMGRKRDAEIVSKKEKAAAKK